MMEYGFFKLTFLVCTFVFVVRTFLLCALCQNRRIVRAKLDRRNVSSHVNVSDTETKSLQVKVWHNDTEATHIIASIYVKINTNNVFSWFLPYYFVFGVYTTLWSFWRYMIYYCLLLFYLSDLTTCSIYLCIKLTSMNKCHYQQF